MKFSQTIDYSHDNINLGVLDIEIEIYHQGRLIKTFIDDNLVLNTHSKEI